MVSSVLGLADPFCAGTWICFTEKFEAPATGKVPAGKTLDRKGQPLLIKLKGKVEAFYR